MRKIILVFLFISCISGALLAQRTKKALFIIADGIPADVIERLKPSALEDIRKQGGYARAYVGGEKGAYSQTPTISAVGYNSLLTGTWVNKHNVWDNDIAAPDYSYWNIFRFLKSEYPDKKTAVFSTWLDNRTKLVGSEAIAAGSLQPDYHFDGLELDTIQYPHDRLGNFYNLIDDAVADTAAASVRGVAPDLSWVYLEFTDEMGHRHGTGPIQDDAVQKLNRQVDVIWKAIQYREKNFDEDWQIWVTTDHGRDSLTGRNHGGQSSRERTTWIYTNAKGLNDRFKKGEAAIVDIFPSIASFLDMHIPQDQLMEIDGVLLTGKISATDLKASLNGKSLDLQWKVMDKTGDAKVWIATSNNFKNGGEDDYKLVATVPVSAGKAQINLESLPSEFYKIVLESSYNDLNRWLYRKPVSGSTN